MHFFLTFVSILTEAAMTPVKMQHTLEVHQIDSTKDQEEAECRDVVPQCNSDTLEQTLKQTLLQVALIQIIMYIHLRKN